MGKVLAIALLVYYWAPKKVLQCFSSGTEEGFLEGKFWLIRERWKKSQESWNRPSAHLGSLWGVLSPGSPLVLCGSCLRPLPVSLWAVPL